MCYVLFAQSFERQLQALLLLQSLVSCFATVPLTLFLQKVDSEQREFFWHGPYVYIWSKGNICISTLTLLCGAKFATSKLNEWHLFWKVAHEIWVTIFASRE